MAVDLFANAANTTLSAALTAGATSLTVTSSTPFPAVSVAAGTQFRVIIDAELFIVTNVTGLTWTVTPGAEGTTQAAHANAAVVTAVATAGGFATTYASKTSFNVREAPFSATGNGTSDDTAAIQAALDAAALVSGGAVIVPAGTYRCNGLRIKSFVSIVGTGWATILKKPGARTVTDGVTTSTSTTVTSATAAFSAKDAGQTIAGAGITAGTTIASVTNATTVVLSAAATVTASAVSVTVTPTTALLNTIDVLQAGCLISNLCIDGSYDLSAQGHGVSMQGSSSYALTLNGRPYPTDHAHRIRDLLIYKVGANAIDIQSRSTQVSGCYIIDIIGIGINCAGTDATVYNNEIGATQSHGIAVIGSSNRVSSNKVFYSGYNVVTSTYTGAGDGYYVSGVWAHLVGNQSQDCGYAGVHLVGAVSGSLQTSTKVSGHVSAGDRTYGLHLDGAAYCDVDIIFTDADSHNTGSLIRLSNGVSGCRVKYSASANATTGTIISADLGLAKFIGQNTFIPSGFGTTLGTGFATPLAPNLEKADHYGMTLTANLVVNAVVGLASAGYRLTFVFTQDATGGRTVTWDATFKNPLAVLTAANATTVVEFVNVNVGGAGTYPDTLSPVWQCVRAS